MQNENIQNQAGQIKRNPTRYNDKINRGPNEKSFDDDISSRNEKNSSSQQNEYEDDVGGSRGADSTGDETTEFSGGPEAGIYDDESGSSEGIQRETQQSQRQSGKPLGREKNEANQAGAGASYGAPGDDDSRTDEDDKQMQGGGNKGGQVGGAFGKDKDDRQNQSVDQGM